MSLASRREQADATASLTVLFRSDLETISAEEPIAFRPDSSNSTVRPPIFSQTIGEQWSRSLGGRRIRLKECVTRYRDLAAQCTDDRFCDKMRTRLHGHFIKESQGREITVTSAEYPMVGTVLTHGYGLCPHNKVESEAHILLVHHDGRLGRKLSEHARRL